MGLCRGKQRELFVVLAAVAIVLLYLTKLHIDYKIEQTNELYQLKSRMAHLTSFGDIKPHEAPVSKVFMFMMQTVDSICRDNDVLWLAWNDLAVSLINGNLLDMGINSIRHEFDLQLASSDQINIQTVWMQLMNTLKNLTGFTGDIEDSIGACVCLIKQKDEQIITFRFFGFAMLDYKQNIMELQNEGLWRKSMFKLDRLLPLQSIYEYGVTIYLPRDPIFVFSHIIPLKQNVKTPQDVKYVYGQGCESQLGNKVNNTNGNIKVNNLPLNSVCGPNGAREVFIPLHVLSQRSDPPNVLRFEDFQDVIPIERGNGQYTLNKPDGPWSQYGQDLFLDKYLNKTTNGFFLEVGGFDGERFSNTLYFEKFRKWDGILIEAIPALYQRIISRNRNCYILNACISDVIHQQTFTHAAALSTSDIAMTDRHKNRIAHEKLKKNSYKHVVNCKSLLDIMNAINVHRIDYFSLDVEGGELIILNSIPWDKIDIDIFTIETDQHRQEIIDFMEGKGYERFHKLKGDDLFRKR